MKKVIKLLLILTAFALITGTTSCDEGNYGEDTSASSGGGGGSNTTQLNTPTNIFATDGEYTSKITITWSAVDNSSSYAVFKSDATNGTYNSISADEGVIETTFTDTDVEPAKTYYYKIKALSNNDTYTASELSDADDGFAREGLATVTGVSATNGTLSSKIGLAWNLVDDATHYRIYRSTTATGTFDYLGEVSAEGLGTTLPEEPEEPEEPCVPVTHESDFTSNVNININNMLAKDGILIWKAQAPYTIRIIVGSTINTEVEFYVGAWSPYKIWDQDDIVTAINEAVGTDSFCTAVSDDDNLFVNMYYNGEPIILINETDNQSVDTFLYAGVTNDQMVVINGEGTRVVTKPDGEINPADYVASDECDGGDDGDDDDDGDNGDVSPYYYQDDFELANDQLYFYKVDAVQKNETSEIILYSDMSNPTSGFIGELQTPSVPENISATDGEFVSRIDISWNESTSAATYRIYMSDTEGDADENYSLIAETDELTYSYATTTQGDFYFKISAVNSAGESELSISDEGSIALGPISNLAFLRLYLETEARFQEQLPSLPSYNLTVTGANSGTADYKINISFPNTTVTVTYTDYCEYDIILNGVNTSIVGTMSQSGTCTGEITISGAYQGTIKLSTSVGRVDDENVVTDGTYTVTQTGGTTSVINVSDL